jgi:hypothetical protein
VDWSFDDAAEEMKIMIYDKSQTPPEKTKEAFIRKFFVQINDDYPTRLAFGDRRPGYAVAPGGQSDELHMLYEDKLSYGAFREGSNTVTLYEEDADRAKAGGLGFPNENNGISFPLNKKGNATLLLVPFAAIPVKALPEKNEVNVKLERPGIDYTTDKMLWQAIKDHQLRFDDYEEFIDLILDQAEPDKPRFKRKKAKRRSPFIRSEEYNLIKFATEYHMLRTFGLTTTELEGYVTNGKLPYYNQVIETIEDELPFDNNTGGNEDPDSNDARRETERIFNPFMTELIWSYWMEQSGLVQTMNVINLRFQNIRTDVYSDRLQRFDVDPLRPLSYILWGYIQDEQHRLSLPRRVNEYDHEYGLMLTGRAVPKANFTDTRVKFLEAFHNLLNLAYVYFIQSDDTTYIADAFPVLNALREVHLLLAEGNHNAYGNLTWTARQEMMMQQYILSRPQMREFLGGRTMVPYPEGWMDRVDTMRGIQGWGETSVLHYYELAIHGEQILLSIRYGNWSDVNLDRSNAANWAQEFRNNIYRYTHAYRVVTGVDLTMDKIQSTSTFAIQPAYLIQQRLLQERGNGVFVQRQRALITRTTKDRKV